MDFIYQLIGSWVLYNAFEYYLHQLGHMRHLCNPVYRLHMTHHKDYYPVTDLQSDEYRGRNEGVIAFLPITCMPIGYMLWIQEYMMLSMITILILTSDYMHTQFHLKGSWLNGYPWFEKRRRIHFIHHRHLDSNFSFGGLSYIMDKSNNTYRNQ
jgi:sterol desaturase/sphingolipid hydroxylase (fatty acid hydroxylase superfamily)